MDRVQRLLQITQRADDVRRVFLGLRSGNRHQRGRAVEFLDALVRSWERGSGETTNVVRLVVDELGPKERVTRAQPLTGVLPASVDEVLDLLSDDPDPTLSALASEARRAPPLSRRHSAPPVNPVASRGSA
jgi:hypothetical protein